MGNWRTVRIVGTCLPDEVPALREALDWEAMRYRELEEWKTHALLCSSGLCGLGQWPAARMDRAGNLFERDYSVEQVAEALRACVVVAPSLAVKVHCGDEWEATNCVATITAMNGQVTVGPAEVEDVGGIPEGQVRENLAQAIGVPAWMLGKED